MVRIILDIAMIVVDIWIILEVVRMRRNQK